jgi:hypothetical protein
MDAKNVARAFFTEDATGNRSPRDRPAPLDQQKLVEKMGAKRQGDPPIGRSLERHLKRRVKLGGDFGNNGRQDDLIRAGHAGRIAEQGEALRAFAQLALVAVLVRRLAVRRL